MSKTCWYLMNRATTVNTTVHQAYLQEHQFLHGSHGEEGHSLRISILSIVKAKHLIGTYSHWHWVLKTLIQSIFPQLNLFERVKVGNVKSKREFGKQSVQQSLIAYTMRAP